MSLYKKGALQMKEKERDLTKPSKLLMGFMQMILLAFGFWDRKRRPTAVRSNFPSNLFQKQKKPHRPLSPLFFFNLKIYHN